MRRKPRQKLAIELAIVSHTQRLAGLTFLIHRYKHGKLLVSVTSDKLFHTAAAPPCAWGFARSLREAPLRRFHSIINGCHRRGVIGEITSSARMRESRKRLFFDFCEPIKLFRVL